MPYTPISPNLVEAVVGIIRYRRKSLGVRYHSEEYTDHEAAGQVTTVGGDVVEISALVKFDGQDGGRLVHAGASARCHGWGCADPNSGVSFADPVPLDADVYATAATVEPLVQAAREWAQTHADNCHAQTYTGR